MNPLLNAKNCIPDVEARQWDDGNVYLYGSKDVHGSNSYCSKEYDVFYSSDLINWIKCERVFNVEDAKLANFDLYAPDCVKIEDKYCLFFCQSDDGEGVAFSDIPTGKFENSKKIPIADKDGIDPSVFVDDDGKVYYFWGQYTLRGGLLDPETFTLDPNSVHYNLLNEEEHGFHEGSSIRKHNGIYYMIFADISRGKPTCLGYATSKSPLGPYEKRGIIIDNLGCDPKSWNNHGSIEEINGQWYVFYHRSSNNSNFSRRVCAEKITIDEDGFIQEVEMTTQGVESAIPCTRELYGGNACLLHGDCYITIADLEGKTIESIVNISDGNYWTYKYLAFDPKVNSVSVKLRNFIGSMQIEVHIDSQDGKMIGKFEISSMGKSEEWSEYQAELMEEVNGIHAVVLVVKMDKYSECEFGMLKFEVI